MDKRLYWIWLSQIKGIGPRRIRKLLDYFEDAQGIWEADREEINSIQGIGNKIRQKIIDSKRDFDFEVEYKKLNKLNIKVVTLADKCYPKLLKEIYDPPPVLYYKGSIAKINLPSLAIVGSRRCTSYGKKIAYKLGYRLAELGIGIVSGMARGIDSAAHKGALQGGLTYAILGSGLDIVYPPENNGLMKRIIDQGAVLTSFRLGTQPEGRNFPVRNRIISGLSSGVIVIEATEKSGSLITANLALQQGREVFAIPGDITKKQSIGTNGLIQEGAKLVRNINDILEELPLLSLNGERLIGGEKGTIKDNLATEKRESRRRVELESKKEEKVYQLLSNKPKQFEYLLNQVNLNMSQLNSTLLRLEMKGLIKQLPGRSFKLISRY